MTATHDWADCRPALVPTECGNAQAGRDNRPTDADYQAAVDQTWATLTEQNRRDFHAFCCLRCYDRDSIALVTRFNLDITNLARRIQYERTHPPTAMTRSLRARHRHTDPTAGD